MWPATLASTSFVVLSFFPFLKVSVTLCDAHLVKLGSTYIHIYICIYIYIYVYMHKCVVSTIVEGGSL